jgi:hypothetical protein
MPQKVTTTTRRLHLITAADPGAAMALVQSGTMKPHKERTTVKTKKMPTGKSPRSIAKRSAAAAGPFVQRVTTITITTHSIADADAPDTPTAEAIAASGKIAPIEQVTRISAARRPVAPPRVAKTLPKPSDSIPNPLPPLKVKLAPAAPHA